MRRLWVMLPLAGLLACTGWHRAAEERERPVVTTPWQSRCETVLRRAAAAQYSPVAGAQVELHSWPGDNFIYHTVSLRGPSSTIALDLTQHEPAIPHDSSDGWRRDVAARQVVWTRNTPFVRASLVVPASPDGAAVVPVLVNAANDCLADGRET